MLFSSLRASVGNFISVTLKFYEGITIQAWSTALRNVTLNCTWISENQGYCCVWASSGWAKQHNEWCRDPWCSPRPTSANINGDVKAISLWAIAALMQLYNSEMPCQEQSYGMGAQGSSLGTWSHRSCSVVLWVTWWHSGSLNGCDYG